MPKYSQANRLLAVTTPLGTDVLLLQQFSGEEAISRLFRFELDLLAESTATIAFDSILGQGVTVTLMMPDGTPRYFNGIVSRFTQGQRIPSAQGGGTFTGYRAEVVPRFWMLTRNHQSRIFQQLAVPDILKQVLTGLSVTYQLQGSYLKRDYCVQYRESDFAFASRLMEEEGIFYFFTHSNGSHQMVVADTPQSNPDVPVRDHVDLRDDRRRNPDRGSRPPMGEVPGPPVREVSPLGLLLRAARQEPGGRQANPRVGPGGDRDP